MNHRRLAAACAISTIIACSSASRGVRLAEVTTTAATAAPLGRTQQQARVIITRASLEVEVEAVPPAVEQATRLTKAFDGYVENATTREDDNAYLRLRVPASRLTEALDSLGRLGKVTGRSLTEEDVTAQSIDLEARVASFRAARDKLRELLDRAASVADAVAAQGELARVQGELDSLEAQLKAM